MGGSPSPGWQTPQCVTHPLSNFLQDKKRSCCLRLPLAIYPHIVSLCPFAAFTSYPGVSPTWALQGTDLSLHLPLSLGCWA